MNALLKKVVSCGMVALACLGGAAVAGPVGSETRWDVDTVNAYSTVFYNEYFAGGEVTNIRLQGDGDTDLDLFVYDEYGRLVASGTGYTDYEFVAFVPNRTGQFRVEIKNLGSVYNVYRIDMW
jgi:hypothetical protein